MLEIVNAVEQSQSFDSIKGIAFKKNSQIQLNYRREFLGNLDELPFPAWDMFPPVKSYPILASRGCPFQCIFCMRVLGNHSRKRNIKKVVEEIEWLVNEFGMNHLRFMDETFSVDRARVIEFSNLMIEKGLNRKVAWEVETRVDCVDEELLAKMKEAGCQEVQFGVESGNQEILNKIGKNITLEQVEKAVYQAKKAKLRTTTFFILGHPNESRKTMQDTEKIATKLNAKTVVFGIMVPYPGTIVAEMAKKGEGGYKLVSNKWTDFNKTVGNSLELKDVPRRQLENAVLHAYLHFYLYNFRLIDLGKLLKNNWRIAKFYLRKLFHD